MLCGLLPFPRLSLRPILRELSLVVVLLPLAGRGRLAHLFNVRRLLLDARAALGRALREAPGSRLRHGCPRYRGSIGCPEAAMLQSSASSASSNPTGYGGEARPQLRAANCRLPKRH